MRDNYIQFNDEQLRVAVNLDQFYRTWIDASRELDRIGPRLQWKEIAGKFYLYRIQDRLGNGTSLGPRSKELDDMFAEYRTRKTAATAAESGAKIRMVESARLYRTLRLGMIASPAARLLQHLDRRGALGSYLMVVGTNAMPAYELEAGVRFAVGMDSTEDFDLAWAGREPMVMAVSDVSATVFGLLREVDPSYTVNTERTFQARNAGAYEVELLVAPSLSSVVTLAKEPLCPIPLPEQEWLLLGNPVDRIVCGRDATPARIVAPDPRYFGMQKLWLSEKPGRDALKRPKDLRQGVAVLDAVERFMPQYPMDDAFADGLPEELAPLFDRWKTGDFRERSGETPRRRLR
jgi:hypothetical protein